MTIYYTIYKITNKVNNRVYIGKHETSNLDDGYLGSGTELKKDKRIFGPDIFEKEILFIFETEEEMNNKEKELVNVEWVAREDTYNRILGGKGGRTVLIPEHPRYQEVCDKISNSRKGSRHWTNGFITVSSKECPGEGWYIGRGITYAKRSSDVSKEKMSATRKNNYYWWNDGINNKRSKECPGEGWIRGRLMSEDLYNKFCKHQS